MVKMKYCVKMKDSTMFKVSCGIFAELVFTNSRMFHVKHRKGEKAWKKLF